MSGRDALSVLAAAREAPDRIAVVSGESTQSYDELAGATRNQIARLRDAGIARAEGVQRVALTCASEPETLVRLSALFELGQATVLLHDRWTARERDEALSLVRPVLDPFGAAPGTPSAGAAAEAPGDAPLVIVFTSGTGGAQKAVLLQRDALVASARASWAHLGLRHDDRWLSCLPLAHVGGLSVFTRCLAARRTVVLVPRFDARSVADAIERHGVTLASLVPTMLERLLTELPRWSPPRSLRAVLLGGAAASPRLLREAHRRGLAVLVTYGMTETASQVATQEPGTPPDPASGCGRPLPGVEIRVRGGVIEVRGRMLADGYLTTDGPRPAADRDGWLSTGDLGRIDDEGRLHVTGRRGDVLVTGGENVSAADVERQLSRCPGIERALVFAVPDDDLGERLAAALVADGSGPPSDELLARHLEDTLAAFKRPRSIVYVERLPETPTGKESRLRAAATLRGRLRPLQIETRGGSGAGGATR